MILLVILFLLILVFDPSTALVILALTILIYGGYFLIATLTDVAISSGHPIVVGVIIVLSIVVLIVTWFKKSIETAERNTCVINGKPFCLSDALELIRRGKTELAIQSIHQDTGLIWIDAKSFADQIIKHGEIPSQFTSEHPLVEVKHKAKRDFINGRIQEMDEALMAHWRADAQSWDCWYGGGFIVAPQPNYWSDGSIKVDRWTGRRFPKGQYFLDSQGQNSTGVKIPPDAKRCPG